MYICKDCFNDVELRATINASAKEDGVCEVCGTRGKVIDFAEFHDFFGALLSLFSKSDSSNKTVADIIQDEWDIFKDKTAAEVLLKEVMEMRQYGFSTQTPVGFNDEIRERVAVWDRIKISVKENLRFFTDIDDFAKYNYMECGDNGLNEGDVLYRSRITPADKKVIEKEQMGCPPRDVAAAGRANPIGIPYLYLSDSPKTTYYEVRALYLDNLSVGKFEVTRNLKLIDFTFNINLYNSYANDDPLQDIIIKKKVLDAIRQDLAKPLRRYDSELEYVPTQFICEYCKHVVGADGITFESSLWKDGRNYVLFDGSSAECKEVESHTIREIDIDGIINQRKGEERCNTH